MGVDLALLPFDGELNDGAAFSHTILNCHRRRELWAAINVLPQEPVPADFFTYLGEPGSCEHRHYGNTQEDPYGARIRSATAGGLLVVRSHEGVQDNAKNRAIWAYLAELPPETRVALYWH